MQSYLIGAHQRIPSSGSWRIEEQTPSQIVAQQSAEHRGTSATCNQCGSSSWDTDENGGVLCSICGAQLIGQMREEHTEASQSAAGGQQTTRSRRMRGRAGARDTRVTLAARQLVLGRQPSIETPGFVTSLSRRESHALVRALSQLMQSMTSCTIAVLDSEQPNDLTYSDRESSPPLRGFLTNRLIREHRVIASVRLATRARAVLCDVLRLHISAGRAACIGSSPRIRGESGQVGSKRTRPTSEPRHAKAADDVDGVEADGEVQSDVGTEANIDMEDSLRRLAALPPLSARGLLPILLFSLWMESVSVSAGEVVAWAQAGVLPFLRAWLAVGPELVGPLYRIQGVLLPRRIPSPGWVHGAALRLGVALGAALPRRHIGVMLAARLRGMGELSPREIGVKQGLRERRRTLGMIMAVTTDGLGALEHAMQAHRSCDRLREATQILLGSPQSTPVTGTSAGSDSQVTNSRPTQGSQLHAIRARISLHPMSSSPQSPTARPLDASSGSSYAESGHPPVTPGMRVLSRITSAAVKLAQGHSVKLSSLLDDLQEFVEWTQLHSELVVAGGVALWRLWKIRASAGGAVEMESSAGESIDHPSNQEQILERQGAGDALLFAAKSLGLVGAGGLDPGRQGGASILSRAAEASERVVVHADRGRALMHSSTRPAPEVGQLQGHLRECAARAVRASCAGATGAWLPALVDALASPTAASRLRATASRQAQARELQTEQRVAAMGQASVGAGRAPSLPPVQAEFRRARLQSSHVMPLHAAAAELLASVSFQASLPSEGPHVGVEEKLPSRVGTKPRSDGACSLESSDGSNCWASILLAMEPCHQRAGTKRQPALEIDDELHEVHRQCCVDNLIGFLQCVRVMAAVAALCTWIETGRCTRY